MTRILLFVLLLMLAPAAAGAQQRFALIVSGASGGEEYVEQYAGWSEKFARTLTERFAFDAAQVTRLLDSDKAGDAATSVNVRKAIAGVRARMTRLVSVTESTIETIRV